eukprot:1182559-Prorocentrum_minimum.AAC.5
MNVLERARAEREASKRQRAERAARQEAEHAAGSELHSFQEKAAHAAQAAVERMRREQVPCSHTVPLRHCTTARNLDALGGSLYLCTTRRPLFYFSNSESGP